MTLLFHELTAARLKELQQKGAVILLSFGSIEQHSSHLPVGTDYLCSLERVKNIAERTESIVLAPLMLGYSFNHKGMFGTVSLDPKLMTDLVAGTLEQLCGQGWSKILLFSGHNGNWGVLDLAVQIAREKYPWAQIISSKGLPPVSSEQFSSRFFRDFDFHAGKVETAILNHYCPELLDKEKIPAPNGRIPEKILSLAKDGRLDQMDMIIMKAMLPQHTELLSDTGSWGISDPAEYGEVPVRQAMENYENFFVRLIEKWKSLGGHEPGATGS